MDDTILDIEFLKDFKDITLPDPSEIEYWKLAKYRTFFIDYDVDEDYRLIELAKTIIRMNLEEAKIPEKDLKPLTLLIFSYGGDLDQANFMCDLIESSRIPIITVATGVAMSAGFLIFLAGKRRYAFEHTSLLVHEGSASFSGTAEAIRQAQENYQKQLEQMREYVLSHTDIDAETFDANRTKDWYLSSKEIRQFKLAKIVKNLKDIK
jgi:ATP-dependent Clp protease protease subunit